MWFGLSAAPVAAQSAPALPPAPKAWIVVDAATGAVLDGGNVREPVHVASTIKLLTALIAVERLDPDASVPVSERAAAMPARKLNMGAGETWTLTDTLYSLLHSSANDAAAALGERLGGTLEDFSDEMAAAGQTLGLEDEPVLRDPSGLDDEYSVGGGNLVSARDIAIISRAALADPVLAKIAREKEYRFTGPDGVPHHLINHNKLLSRYDGAIGMKTGYTKKSGHTLVAAAERGGRQVIAVVLGAVDMYGSAAHLLDKGFATSPAEAPGGHLPPVRSLEAPDELAAGPSAQSGQLQVGLEESAAASGGWTLGATARAAALRLGMGVITTAVVLRARVIVRREARRRRRRRQRERQAQLARAQPAEAGTELFQGSRGSRGVRGSRGGSELERVG